MTFLKENVCQQNVEIFCAPIASRHLCIQNSSKLNRLQSNRVTDYFNRIAQHYLKPIGRPSTHLISVISVSTEASRR